MAVSGAVVVLLLLRRRQRHLAVPKPPPPPLEVLLWLQVSLRLADNDALLRTCSAGTHLLITYVWRHGRSRVPSAAAAFEACALAALDERLRSLGQRLIILHADGDSHEAAAAAVAALAVAARVRTVIVDGSGAAGAARGIDLSSALSRSTAEAELSIVEASEDDWRLVPIAFALKALGRSRAGGGGKVLRWAAFLSACIRDEHDTPSPRPAPETLPPPPEGWHELGDGRGGGGGGSSCSSSARLQHRGQLLAGPLPPLPRWARAVLSGWGEDVSEAAAARLAESAGEAAHRSADIGEHADDERSGGVARPSKLSPYLRFGVLSPRQAAAAGVRRRDLLWRDWSHLCWRLLASLRRGDPVVPPLDGCCRRRWRVPAPDAPAAGALDTHLSELPSRLAFDAWCAGRTGAPLVDAAMRQLWVCGWMPRRLRLLVACCLTEGMGLDWRWGRDWFACTLIDHDPAINEAMWQNAGLCGCDPFYASLHWEDRCERHDDEEDDEEDWLDGYVRRWASEEGSEEGSAVGCGAVGAARGMEVPRWPAGLQVALKRPRPAGHATLAAASARRIALRDAYRASSLVSRAGVRVDHRDEHGEARGVGRVAMAELAETDKFRLALGHA